MEESLMVGDFLFVSKAIMDAAAHDTVTIPSCMRIPLVGGKSYRSEVQFPYPSAPLPKHSTRTAFVFNTPQDVGCPLTREEIM